MTPEQEYKKGDRFGSGVPMLDSVLLVIAIICFILWKNLYS